MFPSLRLWPLFTSALPFLLPFIISLTVSAVAAKPSSPAPPIAIPPFSLPTSYPGSLTVQDPALESQIRNTLSHYPLAIDGKNFQALSLVFTQDVVANYSAPINVLNGLPSVISALEAGLAPVRTQHALSTQVIEILRGGVAARSVTYFTATHFGVGAYNGEVVYAYGQYQDDWVRICCPEEWRIKTRTLVYMGPIIGNLSIFT